MDISKFKNKLIESSVGNIMMFALNLITPMVISRFYGVEIYGNYVYGITIVSMALFLANLGMDVGLLYYIPKTGKKYVTSSFVVNVFTSAIAMGVIYVFMPRILRPYLGLVWLLSAEQLFFAIYRARHHIKDFFIIKSIIGLVGTIVFSLIFYKVLGGHESSIILATYIGVIVSNVFYFYQSKDMFGTFQLKVEFISYSATIILGGVLSLLINYIDIVMIKEMIGSKDVAIYKVGAELAMLPSIFLRIVNTIFPPMISKLYHEGNIEEVRRFYEQITRYLLLVSSVVIGLIFIFWEPILMMYGSEYLASKNILFYRGFGQLINASVGSVWYIVLMTGHPRIRFLGVLLSAILNVTLNFLLIPRYGIDGAAFASMVSTVFVNILGFFVVKKIIGSKVYYII